MFDRLLSSFVILIALTGVAVAGGTWTDKLSFRGSTGTSVKVSEPDGFKVAVTTPEGEKVGQVPEVFPVADQDAFVKVTITAPDGSVWTKKIEVKAKQQTELTVHFTAGDAKPGASRKYIGKLANQSQGCGKKIQSAIKAEFIDEGGGVAKALELDPKYELEAQLPAGTYDVRIFLRAGDGWSFHKTTPHTVPAKDGWKLGWGCVEGTRTPVLVVQ